MEKKDIGIGLGIGLLALVLAAPVASAYMGWQGYGYGRPGMMGYAGGALQAQQPQAQAAGQADGGSPDGWYGAMAQMHNRIFGTSYTAGEFERLHENVGCPMGRGVD